jgi:hypothetical protein
MTPPTIVIAGSLAQVPHNGGLSWFYLQLLLGFKRLGFRVLFLDRLEPEMCVDESGRLCDFDCSVNLRCFQRVMDEFGLSDDYALSFNGGRGWFGQPRQRVLRTLADSPLLLNVMGFFNDPGLLERARRRVFVDIDPGFGQMWRELGLHDPFAGHDDFVTLGRNIGSPGCAIPTCGLKWATMPQPVVLERWPAVLTAGGPFTSIGAWRGPNGPVEFQGVTYGLRVHEFRQFAELPRRCPAAAFEMALDIHPDDARDLRLLQDCDWTLIDPRSVAGTPAAYRQYIAGSGAEFMVPKQMYVRSNSGLLSDRSAYYLASGKPVLARDTGLAALYPTGLGLLTFTTLEQAIAGVEAINSNYARHARAARELAEEFFDSDKVLAGLLDALGVELPAARSVRQEKGRLWTART